MAMQLFIFGTGAHARKVYHYAVNCGWQVVAFIDEATDAVAPISALPVLQVSDIGAPTDGDAMFIAIGSADVRRRIMDRMEGVGWEFPPLVHGSAFVAQDATLGAGVLVAAGAVVETAAVVERGAIIDIGVLLDHDCRVGAFCHLRAGEVYGPHSIIHTPI